MYNVTNMPLWYKKHLLLTRIEDVYHYSNINTSEFLQYFNTGSDNFISFRGT